MGNSKIIVGGKTYIDLTQDTVKKDKVLKGFTAHGADGELITGECTFDVDSSTATATAAEVLAGKKFAKGGQVITGTMKNNGAVTGIISTKDDEYVVPQGSHDGSGTVSIAESEQAKLIAENIRENVTILGVTGNMSGTEDVNAEAVTVTPTMSEQVILPNTDEGKNYIAQVTVAAIPVTETENSAGGMTITIG